jgi:arginyl-tRNA synthetase
MKDQIKQLLLEVLKELDVDGIVPQVSLSENPEHGEYSTNLAFQLAKVLKKSPMDIALQVSDELKSINSKIKANEYDQNISQKDQTVSRESSGKDVLRDIESVEVVAPGFINFKISEARLSTKLVEVLDQKQSFGQGLKKSGPKNKFDDGLSGYKPEGDAPVSNGKIKLSDQPKTIMVEFAHPNTHKAFHIGHLRNITTGECIVRLLESQGYTVIRANYQGDVGMHIAKCLYGIMNFQFSIFQPKADSLLANNLQTLDDVRKLSINEKVEFLGKAYAAGSKAYEESDEAKNKIGEINKLIYAKDEAVYPLYLETRLWSLEYFETIYKRVGTSYDRYYFESEAYELGKKTVIAGLQKGIFLESDQAVIFPGDKFGLHKRVFITGEGNPTYEAKDMGLAPLQFGEYHPDIIIHCVGPEQAGYFQVVFEALAQLYPVTRGREYHLIYGWVRLKDGKMSSRSGNVILGEWLLDEAKKEIKLILESSTTKDIKIDINDVSEKAAVAAVKYSFLKTGLTSETVFDLKEAVNLNGDSGVYLLYTYARCKSVLRKAQESGILNLESSMKIDQKLPVSNIQSQISFDNWLLEIYCKLKIENWNFNPEEHAVARLILQFPDVVSESAENLAPNRLC